MNFIVSANTDIGIRKETNQDSLTVKTFDTPQGTMTFALLCDGMGGLASGEIASASVINAFNHWLSTDFQILCQTEITREAVEKQWTKIIIEMNEKIKDYGSRRGIKLGTTVCALLLTQRQMFILNIGDTRVYEITDNVYQLTKDHTVVAREIELGNLTPEQAENDPRRSVLLQCCGASDKVYPDIFYGETKENAVYMLCSDGFRHVITPTEIYQCFQPNALLTRDAMYNNSQYLIELNKQRMENDNISVILVRTF